MKRLTGWHDLKPSILTCLACIFHRLQKSYVQSFHESMFTLESTLQETDTYPLVKTQKIINSSSCRLKRNRMALHSGFEDIIYTFHYRGVFSATNVRMFQWSLEKNCRFWMLHLAQNRELSTRRCRSSIRCFVTSYSWRSSFIYLGIKVVGFTGFCLAWQAGKHCLAKLQGVGLPALARPNSENLPLSPAIVKKDLLLNVPTHQLNGQFLYNGDKSHKYQMLEFRNNTNQTKIPSCCYFKPVIRLEKETYIEVRWQTKFSAFLMSEKSSLWPKNIDPIGERLWTWFTFIPPSETLTSWGGLKITHPWKYCLIAQWFPVGKTPRCKANS